MRRGVFAVRLYSSSGLPSYNEVIARQAAAGTPTLDQILTKWKDYPGVVTQLQQLNNQISELAKDNAWADIEKQFKHDPASRTIDWEFLEQHMKFPELINTFKKALETNPWKDIDVSAHLKELDAITEQMSKDVREQNAQYQAQLPALEKEMARTQYFRDNITRITIDEERKHEPELFAQIDRELEQYNWDDEAGDAKEDAHGHGNKAHAHH